MGPKSNVFRHEPGSQPTLSRSTGAGCDGGDGWALTRAYRAPALWQRFCAGAGLAGHWGSAAAADDLQRLLCLALALAQQAPASHLRRRPGALPALPAQQQPLALDGACLKAALDALRRAMLICHYAKCPLAEPFYTFMVFAPGHADSTPC